MLLSSEAVWVALLKATKKGMFVIQLLRSMKVSVKCPIIIRVDNIRAILMVKPY